MTIDIKLWDKEVLTPSALFIIYTLIIMYTLGYDTSTLRNGIYPILVFFIPFILFLITSNLESGRKIRTFLLKDTYRSEDQKLRRELRKLKEKLPNYLNEKERPLTYLHDEKLNQHMRDEIDKEDLKVLLFSNLVLISILLIIMDLFFLLILFLFHIKTTNLQIAINVLFLLPILFTCKISLDNWKTSLKETTRIYIQHIKEATDDLT